MLLYIVVPPIFEYVLGFVNKITTSPDTIVSDTIKTASEKIKYHKNIEHTWSAYLTGTDSSYNTWYQFFTWGGPKPSLTDYILCKNMSSTWTKTYMSVVGVITITAAEQAVTYFTTDPFTTNLVVRLISIFFN